MTSTTFEDSESQQSLVSRVRTMATELRSSSALGKLAGPLAWAATGGAMLYFGTRRSGLIGSLVATVGGIIVRSAVTEAVETVKNELDGSDDQNGGLERKFGEKGDRDQVEEASWESFPASDPPGYR